jgi:2',3'-cyclic-nucleotide 2'-phosphodiesterase (5'-nucleotidase family)
VMNVSGNVSYSAARSAPRFGWQPMVAAQAAMQSVKPALAAVPLANRPVGDSFSKGNSVSNQPRQYGVPSLPPVPQLADQAAPGWTTLRILNTNDSHEKYEPLPHFITASRFMASQGRDQGRDVLILNAGDNNVGKEPEEYALQVRLLNMMNYNAVTMGNHELDLGSAGYAKGQQAANFPTVVSNLRIPAGSEMANLIRLGKLKTLPIIVRQPQGTYGIIGVTTPDLKKVVSKSAKLQGEEPQSFNETLANVKAQVDWLQAQGINKVVVLSHMGYDLEQKLAQRVPGIDIIVGGHSHNVIDGIWPGRNLLKGPTGDPVLLTQAGKNGQYMGVADLLFDPQGRIVPQQNKLFNPSLFPADPQAVALKNAVLGKPKPIAAMAKAYDANGNEAHSDPVAQFTADAMRTVSGADIAFVRSAEIRNNFEPGEFTDQDLKALMPFTDPVVRVKLSGQEILDSLTLSAQGVAKKESHPGMLHPSGLTVAMNGQTGTVQKANVFNKSSGRWEPLNPQKGYTIALGEFSVKNDEFPKFHHPERVDWNSGQPLRTFFNWGLQQSGAPKRPIAFQDDGRLKVI